METASHTAVDRADRTYQVSDCNGLKCLAYWLYRRYNNRTYRIDDIDWNLNPGSTFTKRTGETLSYFNYYASVYEKNLTELEQPLLVHRHRRKGSDDEVIYLLPELCSMTGMYAFTAPRDDSANCCPAEQNKCVMILQ